MPVDALGQPDILRQSMLLKFGKLKLSLGLLILSMSKKSSADASESAQVRHFHEVTMHNVKVLLGTAFAEFSGD